MADTEKQACSCSDWMDASHTSTPAVAPRGHAPAPWARVQLLAARHAHTSGVYRSHTSTPAHLGTARAKRR
eukprot:120418-Chlamydomonas_euryale.AAC.1